MSLEPIRTSPEVIFRLLILLSWLFCGIRSSFSGFGFGRKGFWLLFRRFCWICSLSLSCWLGLSLGLGYSSSILWGLIITSSCSCRLCSNTTCIAAWCLISLSSRFCSWLISFLCCCCSCCCCLCLRFCLRLFLCGRFRLWCWLSLWCRCWCRLCLCLSSRSRLSLSSGRLALSSLWSCLYWCWLSSLCIASCRFRLLRLISHWLTGSRFSLASWSCCRLSCRLTGGLTTCKLCLTTCDILETQDIYEPHKCLSILKHSSQLFTSLLIKYLAATSHEFNLRL